MDDLVKVTIEPTALRSVERVYYTFTADGQPVEKDIVVIDSKTKYQTTYAFYMPGADEGTEVTVHVDYKEDNEAEGATLDDKIGSTNDNRDGTGKSVGVGAAFALTYGSENTEAIVGRGRAIEAGALPGQVGSDEE